MHSAGGAGEVLTVVLPHEAMDGTPLIITVTLNPAIDKTYAVDEFRAGEMMRVSSMTQLPGGKGVNVLRVLLSLGQRAVAMGFLGGAAGEWMLHALEREGLPHDFDRINGETRTTVTVVDRSNSRVTELLEPGPVVSSPESAVFLTRMRKRAAHASYVTISGSMAAGLSPDYGAQLVQGIQEAGAKACVDASGEALNHAILAHPYLLKVNDRELAEWYGRPLVHEDSHVAALRALREKGCEVVAVTLGESGSYLCDRSGVWHFSAPAVKAMNPTGSGDAFLAGLVGGLALGETLHEAMALAAGAGASNAEQRGAGQIHAEDAWRLARTVNMRLVRGPTL